jgi:archaemetzincin
MIPQSLITSLLFGTIVLLTSCGNLTTSKVSEETTIVVQPYDGFPLNYADTVKSVLSEMYGVKTEVFKSIPHPKNAFVNIKSPRYRADSLIYYLKTDELYVQHDHVIGLTSKDISTTKYSDFKNKIIKEPKNKYTDWGIFGLGYMPGKSCVVSSYRLEMNVSKEQFIARLKKVSCHEIGHNFGLPHCPNKECIMQDAAETIKTIDNVNLQLCDNCKNKIGMKN